MRLNLPTLFLILVMVTVVVISIGIYSIPDFLPCSGEIPDYVASDVEVTSASVFYSSNYFYDAYYHLSLAIQATLYDNGVKVEILQWHTSDLDYNPLSFSMTEFTRLSGSGGSIQWTEGYPVGNSWLKFYLCPRDRAIHYLLQ